MNYNDLHKLIEKDESNICQVVGYKNGVEVYSDTWHDYKKTDSVHVMSVTKSIISLFVGIAMDKKLINSVNDLVLDYFPDYKIKRGEKTIQKVTLEHLLTMTAPYKYKYEPWAKVCTSDDWGIAALDLLGGKNGITGDFKYSTLGIHILSTIISKTSGMKTVDFANKYLFTPLGIHKHQNLFVKTAEEHKEFIMSKLPKDHVWFSDPQGVATAGYGLCLSAEDMAKIGQMCLNKGAYKDKQIVSSSWIDISTKTHCKCDEMFQNMNYGYFWWIINKTTKTYAAIGNSGNVIYINPSKNIVIAVTSTFKPSVLYRIKFIQKYIEPYVDKLSLFQ